MNYIQPFKIKILLLSIIFLVLSSCAIQSYEMKEFDKSYRLYEKAIRATEKELSESRRKKLKQFRVSGYHILFTTIDPSEQSAIQVVEVKYYNKDYNVERDMTITNKWEWNEQIERWELANPFPDFR